MYTTYQYIRISNISNISKFALESYKKQPKLTDGEKQELDNTDLLKRQTSPERAKIIDLIVPHAVIIVYKLGDRTVLICLGTIY